MDRNKKVIAGGLAALCVCIFGFYGLAVVKRAGTRSGGRVPPASEVDRSASANSPGMDDRANSNTSGGGQEGWDATPGESTEAAGGMYYPEKLNEIHIDDLRRFYGEDSHDIEELALPNEPVLLRATHHVLGGEGTHGTRGTAIQELPGGGEVGHLISSSVTVGDVNEADGTATMTAHMRTLASFVAAPGQQGKRRDLNLDVDSTETYVLFPDNSRRRISQDVTTAQGLGKIEETDNMDTIKTFPTAAMEPGTWYKIATAEEIGTVPAEIADVPAELEIALVGRVSFDGREAYRVQARQVTYSQVDFKTLGAAVSCKLEVEGRYYVDAATGEILWIETEARTTGSNFPGLVGTVARYREEIVPKRKP